MQRNTNMIKRNIMMRKTYLVLLALLVSTLAWADGELTFTADAPQAVEMGSQFRLSYTINTQKVRDFRAPSIKNFDVLMGPSRSQQSSTQIINGQRTSSSSITFTYILMATKEGKFTIPGATIVADGKEMISNSVSVEVLPEDKSAQGSGTAGGGAAASKPSGTKSGQAIKNDDIFITATVSKNSVVEQEAILLTFKIYTAVDLRGFNNVKLPDFKGFHSQEVELPSNQKWKLEHYKGRNYNSVVYRQFVLFPQQSGKLIIEPAQFDASIAQVVAAVDPFDAFFNGGSNFVEVKKSIQTPQITINVDKLPAGKPMNFSGGVGDFSISSSINETKVKTNDAVTIKLVVSGTGNLKLISNPEVEFPADFEVYDPKVDNQVRLTQNGLTGNRVIEYLAIPRHPGTFTIPAVNFSYYDTKAKQYKTLKTEPYTLEVEKGAGNADQVISNFTNKEELKVLGEDIRFIKLNSVKLHPRDSFLFGSITYWLLYIIPALLFILSLIVYRKQVAENANVAKVRNKRANKVATKRLRLAGKLLKESKKEEFYDEVLKALWGYISDKFNIPLSQLNKDNVAEQLKTYGVNDTLIEQFINALNECEFARFAPGDENQAMDKVFTGSLEIISEMENSIKR